MRRLETTQPDKVRLLWPHMPALSGGKVIGNDGNRGGTEAGRGGVPGRGGVSSIGGKHISSANKTLFNKKNVAAVSARFNKGQFQSFKDDNKNLFLYFWSEIVCQSFQYLMKISIFSTYFSHWGGAHYLREHDYFFPYLT